MIIGGSSDGFYPKILVGFVSWALLYLLEFIALGFVGSMRELKNNEIKFPSPAVYS